MNFEYVDIKKEEKDLEQMAKNDNLVMLSLKVNEIAHVIAQTDKGTLTMKLNKGGGASDYSFVLDAVPLDEKKTKELLGLLF